MCFLEINDIWRGLTYNWFCNGFCGFCLDKYGQCFPCSYILCGSCCGAAVDINVAMEEANRNKEALRAMLEIKNDEAKQEMTGKEENV